MHSPSARARLRSSSLAMVALMMVSSLWAGVGPAGGVVVRTVEGATLPLEMAFGAPGSGTFDLSVPAGAYVDDAQIGLDGSLFKGTTNLSESAADWGTMPPTPVTGFAVEDDALTFQHDSRYVDVRGKQLQEESLSESVDVTDSVRLATTSPVFSLSGGGAWAYFQELAISLNSGAAVYDAFTHVKLDIPARHCAKVEELRIQDWLGEEIPYQVAAVVTDMTGAYVTHVELIFPSDLPAYGTNTYRVFYGNPRAQSPDYPPIYLAEEKWQYTGVMDLAFRAAWSQVGWTGLPGGGFAGADIIDAGKIGRAFFNNETVDIGRTFSQVWTSRIMDFGDFQLETVVDSMKLSGPIDAVGYWGIDFRATKTDCYRLVYSDKVRGVAQAHVSLYRVSNTRHLETALTPTTDWRLLADWQGTLTSLSEHLVIIRAQGKQLQVYIDDVTKPLLEATDGGLSTGALGTFQGGQGIPLQSRQTDVSGVYGPMIVLSTAVNVTIPFPYIVPSEERRLYVRAGTYVSSVHLLEGARDALLDVDIILPPGTGYSVDLLAPDGAVRLPALRDGSPVPEGALDDGFKLRLTLATGNDWVTPEMRGWGVGYRATIDPLSGRPNYDSSGVHITADAALSLAPSREVWLKQPDPLFKPGNLPQDVGGISIGCYVPYGSGWRVFYTGRDANGRCSICMATTYDGGRTFTDFRVAIAAHLLDIAWDSDVTSPSVLIGDNAWLMYYIGWSGGVGQVGRAVSGDGLDWSHHGTVVMSPTGQPGDYDKDSIEDVFVMRSIALDALEMYYTGKPTLGAAATYILHASSVTGLVWNRRSSSSVLSPDTSGGWDSGYVADPWVVVTGKQYIMYYEGGVVVPTPKPPAVGWAFSEDGLNFKKASSNPVLEPRRGGLADDAAGITGIVVVEGDRDRYLALYSGYYFDGTNLVERPYIADSGYVKDGTYISGPFDLARAPRQMGPLSAVIGKAIATTYAFSVRTSTDSVMWSEWTEVEVNATDQPVAPARFVQIRVDLHSDFGDGTPKVRGVCEGWQSNVRESRMLVDPALLSDHPFFDLVARVDGVGTGPLHMDCTVDNATWLRFADGSRVTFNSTGTRFAYRFIARTDPGDAMWLRHINFTLGWESMPSEVALDVGDDGSVGWSQAGALNGSVSANVTEDMRAYMATLDGAGPPASVTVPVRVTTATPGIVAITSIEVVLDTPPRIASRTPAQPDVYVDEGNATSFSLTTEEDDGQVLAYRWYLNDTEVPGETASTYSYTPSKDITWKGQTIKVSAVVSDRRFNASTSWTVHVDETTPPPPPVNEPPEITAFLPLEGSVTMNENSTVSFNISARDPDGGPSVLAFRWYINDTLQVGRTDKNLAFRATYTDAGNYTVRVEAFDGKAGVNHTWALRVLNVAPPGPPITPGGGGEEGLPAWLLPLALILILVIIGATAAYIVGRRRGATGAGTVLPAWTEGQLPAEVGLEPATVPPGAPPVETVPAPTAGAGTGTSTGASTGAGTIGRGLAAKPAAAKAAAAGGAAAVPIIGMPMGDLEKERTFVVEEVYVVYNDGRLVHHACHGETKGCVDTDLFGGMFTAIQQFIHDSMGATREGAASQVGRLDYGENTILVERGKYLFLAAIIYGEERDVLREAMRDALNRIEGAYAGVIERWSGDQDQLADVPVIVAPILGLTSDLTRETIVSRTVSEGVKLLSEVEFYQGYVRLKIALRNDTKSVITNVAIDIAYDTNVLRVQRIQPEYETHGTKVLLGTVAPREKKTVAYYLDPLICQESDVDGTATYKDAAGAFKTVTMKRRRADIVCPIFFTEENANTAMLKRLIQGELKESDSKLFTIPKILPAKDAYELSKQVVRGHDVRFVREFVEAAPSFRGEAWFYGVTKVKKSKMVIRTSVMDDRRTVEFHVSSVRMEAITGLLAELGQNLNEALREKYMGRAKATPVIDEDQRAAVRGMGLLIDKYSESEAEPGEVEQR